MNPSTRSLVRGSTGRQGCNATGRRETPFEFFFSVCFESVVGHGCSPVTLRKAARQPRDLSLPVPCPATQREERQLVSVCPRGLIGTRNAASSGPNAKTAPGVP